MVKEAEVCFAILSGFYGCPNEHSVVRDEVVAQRRGFETYLLNLSDILTLVYEWYRL